MRIVKQSETIVLTEAETALLNKALALIDDIYGATRDKEIEEFTEIISGTFHSLFGFVKTEE